MPEAWRCRNLPHEKRLNFFKPMKYYVQNSR
ncbi:hypothetical protein Y888_04175 [Mixta calida B021323]|nr:hypothetical protein Y888_04175 [Mixta calida B021323]